MSLKSGQSLLEVLFASAVATIGLVALVQVATRSVSNSTSAKQRTEATAYASRAMECVRNNKETRTWVSFSGNPGNGCCGTTTPYTCSISSTNSTVVPSPGPNAKPAFRVNVVVTVGWGPESVVQTSDFYLY